MQSDSQLLSILNALRDGEKVAGRYMCQSGDEAIRPADFFFFKDMGQGKKERLSIPNYIRAYGAEGLLEVVRTLNSNRPLTIEFMAAIFAEVADTYMSSTITPQMPEHEALNQEWVAKKRPASFIASTGDEYTVIMAAGNALFINKGPHNNNTGIAKQYASAVRPVPEPKKVAKDATPAPRKRITKPKVEEVDGKEGPVSSD